MEFPCVKCGLCCRFVGILPSMRSYDRGDGVCRNLDETTNLCRIYNSRPEPCRVDVRHAPKGMTEKAYFNANIAACRQFQQAAGVPEAGRSRFIT